jgi:hypothetical protein
MANAYDLTGYAKTGGTVWYANFLPSEVRFVALKPDTAKCQRGSIERSRLRLASDASAGSV